MLNPLIKRSPSERGPKHVDSGFPYRQLGVLAICRLCEPIAFMSIFPYAYRMIESFNITQDESQISVYAGMLITAFAFAEFSSGVVWGQVSDHVGRKPVLIMGLAGTALSMICFGFSRNLSSAILARALGGILNGNVGVLQTTVAELVTKKEHQPRAYSIMPVVWSIGSIIGPSIGGALAMPCESLGFRRGGLFDKFPFLLPNLVCVAVLLCGIAVGVLFLEETHTEKKDPRDLGPVLVTALAERSGFDKLLALRGKLGFPSGNHTDPFDHRGPPPGYRSTESSPLLRSASTEELDLEMLREKEIRSVVKPFNRQVKLIIFAYAILAYHSVSFDALMPTFLSEERMQTKPVLPFRFSGGFGMSTRAIGFMMAVQGVYSIFAQFFIFPYMARRLGPLHASRLAMTIWPVLYFAVPYLVLIPERFQRTGIYAALLTKITFQAISFPSNAILLANAVPSKKVLGRVNGTAASMACLARAGGPIVTGLVHTAGLKLGCSGLAWWAGGLVCAAGALESYWVEDPDGRSDRPSSEGEERTCEPIMHPSVVEGDECVSPRNERLAFIDDLDLAETTPEKA
ncbi:uncharacterized protein Z520_04509 [Fonsecaea multimorphosa CBS 102226]|uniref:Major facilitator superfamily (MFS) profile domain-containing protein n=1 Tax=Fonsecaea multimorphosa CBS 102226 TaxID=1442371 RepID=A0A0D2KT31_9EURO|nr:uncharacterized protein Z520_04509 [Fonsecaea multimorphosa CBS 102226]KIX99873.1 hypothetical protein Z520_04509 [Fonsecaea multimorphosa CBS 102226]OAL26351.1 hypothetical protein AYO22_04269 [Fonsecaea multimorphosa]